MNPNQLTIRLVSKKLSTFLKQKYLPVIEDRDGKNCFYCDEPFPQGYSLANLLDKRKERVFDHLNNDDEWNDVVNLVLAHSICNQRKKQGFREWEIKAKRKLRDNERSTRIPQSHMDTDKETDVATDTNAIFAEIVLEQLQSSLQSIEGQPPKEGYLILGEFLDLVTAKGYKQCGHASQNTMRRIVKMFCTTEFPFICVKDQDLHRMIIRTREPEEYPEE